MKTEQPILITSILAAADLSAKKNFLIKFDGTVCGAEENALGVLAADTDLGEQAPAICVGIALVYSGEALSVGTDVESDSNGRVTTAANGFVVGTTLDASTGADELIRILLA